MGTHRHGSARRITTAAAVAVALAATAAAAEWPGYRGANGDGISSETGFAKSWPEAGPPVLWRVPLGDGYSGMSIVDGRLFTQYGRGGSEYLAALDAASGRQLWELRTDRDRRDQMGDGPRSTPLVDGATVYAVSALGKLYAVRAATGETVWSHDLPRELGGRLPTWGVAASPIVEGDLLLFDVGAADGSVVAFDEASGAVRWKAGKDIPGYSTPIAFTVGGVRQVVFFTGTRVVAVAPADGRVLWTVPWRTSYDVNAATPIFIPPDRLFVSSGYDTGAALFAVHAGGGEARVEELWRSRGMKNRFSSSIYRDGTIYGFDEQMLTAIDAATGEERWQQRGFGHGMLFYADGDLVVLGDRGQLALVEATPEAFRQRASAQVTRGKHWTVPTLAGGRLYVRNEEELVCLDLRREGSETAERRSDTEGGRRRR